MVEDAREVVLYAYVRDDALEETCEFKEDSKVEVESKEDDYDASCEETSYSSCKDDNDELLFLDVCKPMHNVEARMRTNPGMCVENESVLDGLDGSVESKDIDRFDEFMREGSTIAHRLEGPYERMQVVMPEELESQKPMSKEVVDVTSHGCFDDVEESVEDMHLDDVFPCGEQVTLQDEAIWLHQLSDKDIVGTWMEQLHEEYDTATLEDL